MKLNLEIIKSYGFKSHTYKPDWDDVVVDFTLHNGLVLQCLTVCGNEPTKCDALEGYDGCLYIETKEELDDLLSKTYEEVLTDIKSKHSNFDINEYL